ncbi:CRISPR-associated protein Cas5 [Solwaraspora sp. WMMB335]|uniref:CRISPR-associated protein Cas5 n=1 Tax=Solwaraspora sp. WMMB335 TaxID=3404118 RepID=UPI003B95B067
MPGELRALEVTVTAPVVSFRNPLYAGVQVGLPCPPPATVGGMLAAAAGGWHRIDPGLRFAMAFRCGGSGEDLETYHPLESSGRKAEPTPRLRAFLADARLTVWLVDGADGAVGVDGWWRRLRRPVWPLRLGRSQDLVGVRLREVTLRSGGGRQGAAVVPGTDSSYGLRLRLPTAVSLDRARTRWDDYRYDASGRAGVIGSPWSDQDGQAVTLLPAPHPSLAAR